jgi:flagellin-specific chaperone FliS
MQQAAQKNQFEELSAAPLVAPRYSLGMHKQLSAASQSYRREECMNMTPVEVVKKLYDVAIQGCKRNDPELAKRAITELSIGLNFDYPDISVGLFRLYQYSKECIRKGKLDDAASVLQELRTTWVEAFHL